MCAWVEAEASAAWRFSGSCLTGSRDLRSGAQMGGGAGAETRRRQVSARKAERPRCPLSLDLLSISMGRSSRLGRRLETGRVT